jgi:RNA polymerase sigma-70 factor (ECF subfamily)
MHNTPTDAESMHRLATGNQEALQPLFQRHAPLVHHLASQSLGADAAEDIVQDVFLTVWRKATSFDPGRGSFRSWLLQIAHYRPRAFPPRPTAPTAGAPAPHWR